MRSDKNLKQILNLVKPEFQAELEKNLKAAAEKFDALSRDEQKAYAYSPEMESDIEQILPYDSDKEILTTSNEEIINALIDEIRDYIYGVKTVAGPVGPVD